MVNNSVKRIYTSKKRIVVGMLFPFLFMVSLIEAGSDSDKGIWLVILLMLANVFIALKKGKDRAAFLIFNLTFFTFLVSKIFFMYLDGEPVLENFSERTKNKVLYLMALSLVSITIGLFVYENKSRKNKFTQSYQINREEISPVFLQLVTIAFYTSIPFYLITILEKAIYVSGTSYLDYYTTYSSAIPYFLVKIGELNQILFALLFCIEYRKQKLAIPLLLFVMASVISIGIGQRNIFVLNVFMICICLRYANKRSISITGQRLYSNKAVILIMILIPIGVSFLNSWGTYRQGGTEKIELLGGGKDFFISQGGQIEFLANTIEYKDEIWSQAVPYTFASPYNYVRNLLGQIDYGTYSRQNALEGNSLAATQFYITSPGSLISGRGAGCCYVSELYFDFGAFGVMIGNMFLGYFLGSLRLDERRKAWVNAFVVLMIRWIIYIPRASYFDWIVNAFNIWNIAVVIAILLMRNVISGKKEVKH